MLLHRLLNLVVPYIVRNVKQSVHLLHEAVLAADFECIGALWASFDLCQVISMIMVSIVVRNHTFALVHEVTVSALQYGAFHAWLVLLTSFCFQTQDVETHLTHLKTEGVSSEFVRMSCCICWQNTIDCVVVQLVKALHSCWCSDCKV